MTHELKTYPDVFEAVYTGKKTFEVRLNDRNFQLHDILFLREYDPRTDKYTGRQSYKHVIYILNGGQFGIEEGFVVMSIK